MKVRTAIARTARRLRLTALGWGLMTILACVALSACTGTTTGTTTPPSVYSPSPGSSTSVPASGSASASASGSESANPSESASQSASQSPAPSPASTSFPAAPVTGGGGTAGFEDTGLAVLGGVAIAAGLVSIAYRRWLTRRR